MMNALICTNNIKMQKASTNLLDRLREKQKIRWQESVEEIDFTHSSRKAWNTINKLTDRNNAKKTCPVPANVIGKQVVANGIYPGADKLFQSEVKRAVTDMQKRPLLHEEYLGLDFSSAEIIVACKLLKPGKAQGPDGIHNAFLIHMGPKLTAWISSFFNVCFNSCHIPRMWRRSTVIAILKPGKDENLPSSYRPISLFCTWYKLLNRVILFRIIPIILLKERFQQSSVDFVVVDPFSIRLLY